MASKKCSFLTVYKISLLRTRGWFCKLPACYFLDQAFGGHEVELHLPVPWPLSELPHIVPLKELIWLILLTFTRRKFLINFLKSIHTFGCILLYLSTYKYCINKKKTKCAKQALSPPEYVIVRYLNCKQNLDRVILYQLYPSSFK